MKAIQRIFSNRLQTNWQTPGFWLLTIAGGIAALQLHIIWRITQSAEQVSVNAFFLMATFHLLWCKRDRLALASGCFSSFCGISLIAWVFLRSTAVVNPQDVLFQLSPAIAALGLALLASGRHGFRQYWRELLIVFLLVGPIVHLYNWLTSTVLVRFTSLLTAQASTFLLWYLGFDVVRRDIDIMLPNGAVQVSPNCSGLGSMLMLLQLTLLALMVFPLKLLPKVLLPIAAIAIAFGVNTLRVAFLAFLVADTNSATFSYWHDGPGVQVFSTLALFLFGGICYLLVENFAAS